MHKNTINIGIVALIIGVGIGAAGAGMFVHPAAPQNAQNGFANGSSRGGMTRNGANGGGFLTGTVAASDAGSITLNTRDGSSHVILITPATTVSRSVNGSLSDVTTGATIIVSGTTNSDGSVSANLIQLRPAVPQVQ